MLCRDVCEKCRCFSSGSGFIDMPPNVWSCSIPYKPGDTGASGYHLNATTDPPKHCDHKLEHAVAAGMTEYGA
jgi:hypothetical protein